MYQFHFSVLKIRSGVTKGLSDEIPRSISSESKSSVKFRMPKLLSDCNVINLCALNFYSKRSFIHVIVDQCGVMSICRIF